METLWFGLKVAGVGMGVVFVELIILSYATQFMSKMFPEKKPTEKHVHEDLKEQKETKRDLLHEDDINPEVIAVIAAAVAATMGGTKYRITAIRKLPKDSTPAWSRAGRLEQLNSNIN